MKRLKPAPEPYRMAAESLRAGCAAAFIARPGKVLDPLSERPDVVGADLAEVAARIVEVEAG